MFPRLLLPSESLPRVTFQGLDEDGSGRISPVMPLRGVDGRFYDHCVVCGSRIPEEHKTLRIHLSREHSMELLPGCPVCFYFRSRWSDVKKHCLDKHLLDIDAVQGSRGCSWGLTVLDSSRHRPSYAYVLESDICDYPLASETLTKHQQEIRGRAKTAARSQPSTSGHQQGQRTRSKTRHSTRSASPRPSSSSRRQPRSTVTVVSQDKPSKKPRTKSRTEDGGHQPRVQGKGKGRGKSSSRPRVSASPVASPPRQPSPPRPRPESPAPRARHRRSLDEVTQQLATSAGTSSSFLTVMDSPQAVFIPVLDETEPVDLSQRPATSTPRDADTSAEFQLPSDLPGDVSIVYPEAPSTRRRPRKQSMPSSLTSTPEQQPLTPGRETAAVSTKDQATSAAPSVVDVATAVAPTTATIATQTAVSLTEEDVLFTAPRSGGRLNVTPF